MGALVAVFAGTLVVLMAGLFAKRGVVQSAAVLVGLIAMGLAVYAGQGDAFNLRNMLVFDHFALSFTAVMCLCLVLIMLVSGYGFRQLSETLGDNYGLLLFSLCGGICMVSFQNMVMLFLGIEILSIPLYVLAGSRRHDLASNEAAVKYFLLGSFATGFILLGMAFLYGATGTFDITAMAEVIKAKGLAGYAYLGFILLSVGLFFKISAAPFHFWSPDVYHGSPTMITTFMASVVKIAAFGAFIRLFNTSFIDVASGWMTMIAAISALTMFIGNFGALMQKNFKRMLAYSSVSHAGYLLLGIVALPFGSVPGMLYYLAAYGVATIIAFTIFMIVSEQNASENISVFNGLGKKNPLLAISLAIALLSMAGIPPLAGFFGKYFLFTKAMQFSPLLVIIAIVNSAVSIAYYFRPIAAMYFTPKEDIDNELVLPAMVRVSIISSIVFLVLIMIFPGYLQGLFS